MKKQSGESRPFIPASTPEARENQLIALATDLAEEQLRAGTASSQVVTHFLKLGSMKESLEREKLERENELLKAKAESLQSAATSEELFKEAIAAFGQYRGDDLDLDEDDMGDDYDYEYDY